MAKAQKENKELEQFKTNLPVEANFLDEVEAYAAEDQQDDFGSEDIITPRMRILQSNSPQVKKSDQKYIKGAEEGMIINSATGELFSGEDGFIMIPCYYQREWVEWIPQNAGGGLVRKWLQDESFKELLLPEDGYAKMNLDYDPSKPLKLYHEEKGKWISHYKGTEIVQTANYYVIVYNKDNGRFYPAILGLSGTELKKSKPLASKITGSYYVNSKGESKKAPYQYYTYLVRTVPEKNDKGSWFGFKVDQDIALYDSKDNKFNFAGGKQIWEAAVEFRKLVLEGRVKTVDEQESTSHGNTEDDSDL